MNNHPTHGLKMDVKSPTHGLSNPTSNGPAVARGGALECNLTGKFPFFQESPQPVWEKNLPFDTLFRNF